MALFEKKIIEIFKSRLYRRCDNTGNVFYFCAEDFDGLIREPFSFKSKRGDTLYGYFYHYVDYKGDRIIVFDHGFGGGHTAYMKEIERLCSAGYLVFAYDHTGCMESEGETPNGFSQSLCDLDDCITALKKTERCRSLDFSVMGHSWGGFSTMNICALHPDISHVVSMSGFVCVADMIKQSFSGLLSPYRRAIMRLESDANPDFVGYNGIETLKNTDARVLLIYSSNDKMVKKKIHYDALRTALADKENVELLLEENKDHNPNYTRSAVSYLAEFMSALTATLKAGGLSTPEEKAAFVGSYDWNKMTEQDERVWEKILSHFEK